MPGINDDLYKRLESELLRCGPFDSNDNLRAIFVNAPIYPWRSVSPTARSAQDRVRALIDVLHNQYNEQDENALVLFLRVLVGLEDMGNDCRVKLSALADALQAEIKKEPENFRSPLPPVDPGSKRKFNLQLVTIIITLVVILVGVFIGARKFLLKPTPMPDGFNIAIAQFAQQDTEGNLTLTEASQQVTDWLFYAIDKELKQLPHTLPVSIRGPDDIGIIRGESRDVRAENAAKAAQTHGADILVYGIVTAGDDGYKVAPEFYVSGNDFEYGSEVVGAEKLGLPVPFTPPLEPGKKFAINKKLNTRAQALQYIVRGLASFYVRSYDEAAIQFAKAAALPDWEEQEGKEVAYLLEGAAHLRDYDLLKEDTHPLLEAANEAFLKAQDLNPDYARSYLGLGAVALQQATFPNAENTGIGGVDPQKLAEADAWHARSVSATEQIPSAYVNAKASYGRGQVHLLGVEYGIPGWSRLEAVQFFDIVVTTYEVSQAPDLAWFAAHAYACIGRVAGLNGDWESMAAQHHEAIEILDAFPVNKPLLWVARYWAQVAFAEKQQNRLELAHQAYQEAIRIGTGIAQESEVNLWEQELASLEEEGK